MKKTKLLAGTLAAAMAFSLFPVNAFAAVPDQDGTYTKAGLVQKYSYAVDIDISVNNGKITSVAYNKDTTVSSQHAAYAEMAIEGINEQIQSKSGITSVNDIDTVSGATLSSNSIKLAVSELTDEDFDIITANSEFLKGKDGTVGIANSQKQAANALGITEGTTPDTNGKSDAWLKLYDLYQQAVSEAANPTLSESEQHKLMLNIDWAIAAVKKENPSSGGHPSNGNQQKADDTALKNLVDSAKALNEKDYTADSWKALQQEIEEADQLLALPKKNQDSLDSMQKDLQAAIDALIKVKSEDNSTTVTPSTTRISIEKVSVSAIPSQTYNGKAKTPSIVVKNGADILKNGTDYTVTYKNNKNAGTAYVLITGKGNYTDTITKTFVINKAAQKISVKKASVKYKASALKKAKKSFSIKASASGKGKITYKVTSYPSKAKSFISVSKTGKVTLKKKAKKGTYKVKVSAASNSNYKSTAKTITIKVK